jgi:hypothetical protein
MNSFAFHGDLFQTRDRVRLLLANNGFNWLTHFGSIDLLHDVYGLEVTAISSEADAVAIEKLLRKQLREWRNSRVFYESNNVGEIGWKVIISRDPEQFSDCTNCPPKPRRDLLTLVSHALSILRHISVWRR